MANPSKKSAGILAYRTKNNSLEVLLTHPGGPFWSKKDVGVWSIPKGEFNDDEDPLLAAKREFEEELGVPVDGKFIPLHPVKQKGGKTVYAWAVEADIDVRVIKSNFFEMEWPPKSGRKQSFPEVDKAGWFTVDVAKEKMIEGQRPLVEEVDAMF